MVEFGILEEIDTGLTADSVEWCPLDGHNELLACGTYQLTGSKRIGSLLLFRYLAEEKKIQGISDVHGHGILDVKWSPFGGPHLATANSGGVSLYQYNSTSNNLDLVASWNQQDICLSLDWTQEKDIVVSRSSGKVAKLNVSQDKVVEVRSWIAHNHEAWIVTGDKWNDHVIYSGADDCRLLAWDTRGPCHQPIYCSKQCQLLSNYNYHEMGVCSLQSNSHQQYSLLSGSYDETICEWDTRNFTGGPLTTCAVGGGVWRLKCHPSNSSHILAACMRAGFMVLSKESGRLSVVWNAKLDDSEHLAYGADWKRDSHIIATCCFYNHLMQLWRLVL